MDKENTLLNLNEYLFAQMKRISDPTLKGDELKTELMRSRSVAQMGNVIISNAELVLKAQMFKDNMIDANAELPKLLDGDKDESTTE